MVRFLVVSLGGVAFFSVLMGYIVFSHRITFPAHQQIVFERPSQDNQNRAIYSIQPNSSFGELFQLVFYPNSWVGSPIVTGLDCAPDGGSLIFWYHFLYRYDLADQQLTHSIQGQGAGQVSAWSRDGKQIAYIDTIPDRQPRQIFVIQADGSHETEITANPYSQSSLSWSPDDAQIAYTYYHRDNIEVEGLAVIDVASKTVSTLYEGTALVNDVSWSPDGKLIAFDKGTRDAVDLYTVKPDGSALTRLAGAAQENILPRWSPDGRLISFSARGHGEHYRLYVTTASGGDPYLITRDLPNYDILNRCWLTGVS